MHPLRQPWASWRFGALLAFCGACAGGANSNGDGAAATGSGATGSGATGSGGSAGGGTGGDTGGTGGMDPGGPAARTRAARLTHAEWGNAVRDLFHLDEAPDVKDTLRGDPKSAGFLFDNNDLALEVDQALWAGYERAAASIAEFVTSTPDVLGDVLPEDTGDDALRARAFVTEFGQRVHRRPLSASEIDEYFAVFEAGQTLFSGVNAFEAGIRLLLETFLQSPSFLYRLEKSEAVVGDIIALDDWEIAERLAFFLWDSMPDEELFRAARAGELKDPVELEKQARRLLSDPRARDVAQHFHDQLFELERYGAIAPSDVFFPDVSPDLGRFAREEHTRFVEDVVFEKKGGYRELLTSTNTFVNAELARIYGLSGDFDDEFTAATLDGNQRRGLLTQIGFLASHATSAHPDPIHRGVFLLKRVTCTDIAAPPDNVPPLPPIENTTNREAVAAHTEQPGTACVNCHAVFINPLGFPFENYDAIGGYRTMDNGFPVDASADPLVGETEVHVSNALELVNALAESDEVHACYAKHWLEFSQGRPRAPQDEALIRALGAASKGGQSLLDLIVTLVKDPGFVTRSKEELP